MHGVLTSCLLWSVLKLQSVQKTSATIDVLDKNVRIFTYNLSGAGLIPPLSSFRPGSSICSGTCQRPNDPTAADLCNFAYGSPEFESFAKAYQGIVWSNQGRGESLTIHAHNRLLNSKYHTNDADQADIFFIPIYPPQLCMPNAYSHFRGCGADFQAYTNYTQLWEWMLLQPSFRSSDGRDHFMIISRPWEHVRQCGAVGLSGLEPPSLATAVATRVNNAAKLVWDGTNLAPRLYAVPYATSFHFIPDKVAPDLEVALRGIPRSAWRPQALLEHPRPLLAAYIGTKRDGVDPHSRFWLIKKLVATACEIHSECLVYDVRSRAAAAAAVYSSTALSSSSLAPAGYSSLDAFVSATQRHFEAVYHVTRFCLMPSGDTASRRGLFDAILMGCVPVVFWRESVAFPWHLPQADINSWAVLVEGESGARGVMSVVEGLGVEEEERRRERLLRLTTRVQYGVGEGERDVMGPDAFELLIEGVWLEAQRVGVRRKAPLG